MKNILIIIFALSTLFGGYKGYKNRVALEGLEDRQEKTLKRGQFSRHKTPETYANRERHQVAKVAGASGEIGSQIENQIRLVFGEASETAIAIARAEHRTHVLTEYHCTQDGDGGYSLGVFQIYKVHWPKYGYDNLHDCAFNIRAAYEIYKSWGSFRAWSTYNDNTYLSFVRSD